MAGSENPTRDNGIENGRDEQERDSRTDLANPIPDSSSISKVRKKSTKYRNSIKSKNFNVKDSKSLINQQSHRRRRMLLNKMRQEIRTSNKQNDISRRNNVTTQNSVDRKNNVNTQKIIQKKERLTSAKTQQIHKNVNTQKVIYRRNSLEKVNVKKLKNPEYKGYISESKKNAEYSKNSLTDGRKAETTTSQRKYQAVANKAKAGKYEKVNKRLTKKRGRKSTYGIKKLDQKAKMLKSQAKPKVKGGAQTLALEMMIDKVGREKDGSLNIIGAILTMIMILVLLFPGIKVMVVLVIVITIVAVIITIWALIASLFVVKTEDMAIAEAYRHVTYLDAMKNKNVYDSYHKLVTEGEYDEVYFNVNNIESDPERFLYASNGDSYLYYLNAKFENYDIDDIAIAKYRERVHAKTGHWIPWTNRGSTYAVFKEAPHPMTKEPIKVNRVRDEIHAIHDMVYSYNLNIERGKEVEIRTVTIDSDTGEEKVEIEREIKDIATIDIKIQTLGEMLDSDPKVDVYVDPLLGIGDSETAEYFGEVAAFDDEEVDKYYPISELERFENKILFSSPFGRYTYGNVIENYGYRGRDPSTLHNKITLEASPGTPVYSIGIVEEVDKVIDGWGITTDTGRHYVHYTNINPVVRRGQDLSPGDLIGYTKNEFDGNLLIDMQEYRFWHRDPFIYPAVYIDKLTFSHETELAYLRGSGGLRGLLINPPEKVTQWRQKVELEAQKNEISSYDNAILSIIWEETGGDAEKNPDIMNVKNALNINVSTPERSIEVGVEYFAKLLKKAEDHQLDGRAAVQAYNYGEAYLDDLIERNGQYSFDDSRLYAREKANGKTVSFNHSVASDLGYTWRYEYKNMFYAQIISNNIVADIGRMAEVAVKEIGTITGEKYWRWAGFTRPMEWSVVFVSWVADQVGYLDQGRVLNTSNARNMMQWFQEQEKFTPPNEDYQPQSGDIVFFDWNGGGTGKDHVGIVEFSGEGIVQVIEGNSDKRVRRRTYALDSSVISGYGTP